MDVVIPIQINVIDPDNLMKIVSESSTFDFEWIPDGVDDEQLE